MQVVKQYAIVVFISSLELIGVILLVNYDFSHMINLRSWNRKMINAYWVLFVAAVIGESAFLIWGAPDRMVYWQTYMLPSSITIVLILGTTELINKLARKFNEYIIIVSGVLITFSLLYIHTDVSALYSVMFLPILISVFYFQTRKVLFAAAVMVAFCTLLYYLKSMTDYPFAIEDYISILGMLCCGTVICLGIMHRGSELLQQLRLTLESRQELLVKNIVMDRMSKCDPLTGLYNHITFHEYIDRLTEQSDKFNLQLQLAILDIDNFKKVNDSFGHRAGDIVLTRVAEIIQQHVRENDFLARYGGEEFAVLFTEKSMDDVYEILENMRKHVAEFQHAELVGQPVTISGGVSEYITGYGKERLFHLADEALYEAKKTGKNRIVIKYPDAAEASATVL